MIERWVHIVSPGEFDKQPHLFCVGTASENSPTYCMQQKGDPATERCVFQYTLEGSGLITYHGTTYPVEPGSALIFSRKIPDVCYFYPPKGTGAWRFVFCEFYHFDEAVEQLNSRHGPVYELGTGNFVVQKLLDLIARQPQREAMIRGVENFKICTEIIEEMDRIVEAKDRGEKGSLAIKARDAIFEQRTRTFSLPDLARQLGVTSEHLCREFRRHLNISPKQYHDQLRVKLMQERFMNSDLPTKKIAHEFGFENTSNFIAFFKKHSGVTPGEFRRTKL